MKSAPTIWINGLSCAGKSVLADGLRSWLAASGIACRVLDGSDVRESVGGFLGYSRDERVKVNRVMCAMATLLNEQDVVVIATSISPYQESRDIARNAFERYFEIYLECPVEVCIDRDESNNYARALRGDLTHFIGVDDPFEVPRSADLSIDTSAHDVAATLQHAIDALDAFVGVRSE